MKTLRVSVIAACTLLGACGSEEPLLGPAETPLQYVVSGTIRDDAGLPVAASRVEATGRDPLLVGHSTITDDGGAFRFEGLTGPVTIRAEKVGHYPALEHVLPGSDLGRLIRLRRFEALSLGNTVSSRIDQPCSGWRSPHYFCRGFHFRAPASGWLVVSISTVFEELDATIALAGAETDLAYNWGFDFELAAPVTVGGKYEVLVYSYTRLLEFELRADLHPE